MVLSGNIIKASLLTVDEEIVVQDSLSGCVDLHNLLTQDDLEDEDCMEESLNDIRELALKYGDVSSMDILKKDYDTFVRINFEKKEVAAAAVEGFCGMVIGGQIIV